MFRGDATRILAAGSLTALWIGLPGADARGPAQGGFPSIRGSMAAPDSHRWTLDTLWGGSSLWSSTVADRRGGRGIPPTMQLNRTHMAAMQLPSKLEFDTPACTAGTPENAMMQAFIDATTPGGVVPCCDDRGLFMPMVPYEYLWNKDVRAFLYIVTLLWCFVGVSVLADAFMAGIEAITAWTTKKERPRVHRDGSPVMGQDGKQIVDIVEEHVWNEKVACLTLFALGSSAPEILIACVGMAPNFEEDALGPGTIVGSATFNLYVHVHCNSSMHLCMLLPPPPRIYLLCGLTAPPPPTTIHLECSLSLSALSHANADVKRGGAPTQVHDHGSCTCVCAC